jgi:hypothetical protein
MLEATGDLGLDQEPESAGGIVGAVVQDLLESDFAFELGIEGDEHRQAGLQGQKAEEHVAGRVGQLGHGVDSQLSKGGRVPLGRSRAGLIAKGG